MKTLVSKYIFKGFGFDVLLKNIFVETIEGEEFPEINMNDLKLHTAKALLIERQRLTGNQLKFLRTFAKLSFDDVAQRIRVPASTLRSWENRGKEFTGFSVEGERAFRVTLTNIIFDREKSRYDIELSLTKDFLSPSKNDAIDVYANLDSVQVSNK
ncbi:hypothetical protein AZI86_10890 [Bdellovibrio bacteriovorus]|uniref:Uncharacterized protein n=1 Tax=Bdellovibrio bacteriovorus TaxID=959 RepID=A0A150WL25_BDEBC|nr:transcriptional regulator [Bdellovibrio bacteriovorus]KYG64709.1 hypothetical protein AZI86_10890 [Bdellovibrio bacteriovorus]